MISIRLFWIQIPIICLLLSNPTLAQSEWHFALVSQPEDRTLRVTTYSPSTSDSIDLIELMIPSNHWLSDAVLSPGGTAVVLVYRYSQGHIVTLLDLRSRVVYPILEEKLLAPNPDGLMDDDQNMVWSPDGRYLAFHIILPPDQTDLYLYDAVTRQTHQLTDDGVVSSRIAWSNDSDQLAAISTVCAVTSCASSLDVFDPVARKKIRTIDISSTVLESATPSATGVCHLAWSPSGRYISFMANCSRQDYGYPKEMYLIDMDLQRVARITDVSYLQTPVPPLYGVFADFEPIWQKDDTLLISTRYGNNLPQTSLTSVFNPKDRSQTLLSDHFIGEWAINPVTDQIAFHVNLLDLGDGVKQPSAVHIVNDLMQMNTGASNDEAISRACHIEWSPDGLFLAAVIPLHPSCDGNIERIAFFNPSQDWGNVLNWNIPQGIINPIVAGWVKAWT